MSIFALVSGVVAKFVLPDVEVTKLKVEVDDLKRQLVDSRNEVCRWQRLYEEALNPQERERRRQTELYQAMAAQQAMAMVCHCVPGRHELLLGPRGL